MIKLNKQSLELLKKCLQNHNSSLIPIIEDMNKDDYTESFYNELREIVGNELINNGLNENDEPNEYGYKLEKLIDEIGRLFLYKK